MSWTGQELVLLRGVWSRLWAQVEVQTEPVSQQEKWTQKPPRVADTEDAASVAQNLLGVGGGDATAVSYYFICTYTVSAAQHCKEYPNYVFLSWELRGLSPNFHIHMSVSDLYIPRSSPHISLQQNRETDPGNI